jgi:hypothetical protein
VINIKEIKINNKTLTHLLSYIKPDDWKETINAKLFDNALVEDLIDIQEIEYTIDLKSAIFAPKKLYWWHAIFANPSDELRSVYFPTETDPTDEEIQHIAYEEFSSVYGMSLSLDNPGDWHIEDIYNLS